MKLELDLIPQTAKSNLRYILGGAWAEVSRKIRSKNNYTCQVCGNKGRGPVCYHTHEVWSFDSVNYIQRLERFECLCKECHAVKHWGRSQITGQNMGKLLEHALKVNSCSKAEWCLHLLRAKKEWEERSDFFWTLSWEHWRDLL